MKTFVRRKFLNLLALYLVLSGIISGCSSPAVKPSEPILRQELPMGLYSYQLIKVEKERTKTSLAAVSEEAFVKSFSESPSLPIIFFGEFHAHPGVHLAQYEVLKHFYNEYGKTVLTMEQFSQDKQSVVSEYLADVSKMGEKTFEIRSKAWPNYLSDYRPLMLLAQQHESPVIAANAPRSAVRCISSVGREGVKQIPENLQDYVVFPWGGELTAEALVQLRETSYFQRFLERMTSDLTEDQQNRQFAAQQVWDETMAHSIFNAAQRYPEMPIVHVVGAFHVEQHDGIVKQVRLRQHQQKNEDTEKEKASRSLVTVIPVMGTYDELFEQAHLGDYLLWVNPVPVVYTEAEIKKYSKLHKREKATKCEFGKPKMKH